MAKEDKIKLILAISYAIIVVVFLWAFFTNFSLSEITSYDFIKENRNYLNQFKTNNYLLSITLFFIFTIGWVLLLGFGTPIALLGGFIFGKWIGTLIVAIALSIGVVVGTYSSIYVLTNVLLSMKISADDLAERTKESFDDGMP